MRTAPDQQQLAAMKVRVFDLSRYGLTLPELRRRVRGHGTDTLRISVVGRAFFVSAAFGAVLEALAFSGGITLESGRRGQVFVHRGRLR